MIVEYENRKGKFKKILSLTKITIYYLKPMTWCKIKFNTNNSKLMVFCDRGIRVLRLYRKTIRIFKYD